MAGAIVGTEDLDPASISVPDMAAAPIQGSPLPALKAGAVYGMEDLDPASISVPSANIVEKTKAENQQNIEAGKATSRALLDSITLGHYPQLAAKTQQVLAGEGISNDAPEYVKRRDAEIAQLKADEEKYPMSAAEGKIGGFILPMFIGGAPEAAAKIPTAMEALGIGAKGAAIGGAIGAAQNPGDVPGKVEPLQLGERAGNVPLAATLGGGLSGTLAGAQSAWPASAKWVAQKFNKIMASIPEAETARYIENPQAIEGAKSVRDISQEVLDLKGKTDQAVADSHENLDKAKKVLSDKQQEFNNATADRREQLRDDLSGARSGFADASRALKESLSSKNLTYLAGNVMGAVKTLKQQVIDGSSKAYDILDKAKGQVPVQPLIDNLQKRIDDLRIGGVAPTAEAETAAKQLKDQQMRLWNMSKENGGNISLPDAKSMMQLLDKATSYDNPVGSFSPSSEQALKELRSGIDASVKGQSKEYAAQMETVSGKAKLLDQARDLYGTPEDAIRNLNQVDSQKGQALHVPILSDLEAHTGADLKTPVNSYIANQRVLNTPSLFLDAVRRLPEHGELKAAQEAAGTERAAGYIREARHNAVAPHEELVSNLEKELAGKKSAQEAFSGITPQTVEGAVSKLGSEKNLGAEIRWGDIDKVFGTDFTEQIKNASTKAQFQKSDTAGSRKTTFGSAAGLSVGTLLGMLSGHMSEGVGYGLGLGSAAGITADKYAGPISKAFTDAITKAGSLPGKVSPLAPAVSATGAGAALSAPDNFAKATKGPDKWAYDGAQNLLKHGADTSAVNPAFGSEKGKDLLKEASGLAPGSKAMENVKRNLEKLKKNMENK